MFGLFKQQIGNEEFLDLIFFLLVDLRTSFRSDDKQYDLALSDMPKFVNKKCDVLNKKIGSGNQAYADLVGVACRLNAEKIRSHIDQMLAILDIPNPTQTQIVRLKTLRHEIESIFMVTMKADSANRKAMLNR